MLIQINFLKKYSLLFFIVLLISCENKDNKIDNKNKIIVHPTADNLLAEDAINSIIYIDNKKNNELINNAGEVFVKKFDNKNELLEIGSLDGDRNQIFSSIDEVIINDDRVIIFDKNNIKISIFDIKGNFIKSFGNQGRGPGELTQPNDMTLINDKIYISDRLYSVKMVDLSSDSADITEFLSDLSGFPEGICSSKNTLIIKSLIDNSGSNRISKIFHSYDITSKQKITSFGSSYGTNNPITKEVLSEGIFTCSPNHNGFIYSIYALPYVYFYDSSNVKWISKINSYLPLRFRQEQGVGISVRWDESDFKYDEYKKILRLGDYILLQIERFENSFNNGEIDINKLNLRTYLINSKNGNGTYLGDSIPLILFANDEYMVLDNNEDFPGIKIFKL